MAKKEITHDEAEHYKGRSIPDAPAESLIKKILSGKYNMVRGRFVRVQRGQQPHSQRRSPKSK